ncbi:MAG: hypothetical protein PHO70_06790 [Candidatus Omnitrophica bacterium]|nr:hypothetical protein [Candidatus Omnitrophota bacterium]
MIDKEQIKLVQVIFTKINFERKLISGGSRINLQYNLSFRWDVKGIHKEKMGIKFNIGVDLRSDVLNASVEGVLTTEFVRTLSQDEIDSLELKKICLLAVVPYLIQLFSEMTTKLGFSPLIIPESLVEGLINNNQE